MNEEEKREGNAKRALRNAGRQGGAIGVGLAPILSWVAAHYLGVQPPDHVVASAAGLLGAVGTYIQTRIL